MDPLHGGEPIIADALGRCGEAKTRWPRPVYRRISAPRADVLRQRAARLSGRGLPFSVLLHLAVLILLLHVPGSPPRMASLEVFVAEQPSEVEEALGTEPSRQLSPPPARQALPERRQPPRRTSQPQPTRLTTPLEVPRRTESADPLAVDGPVIAMTEAGASLPPVSVLSPSPAGVHIVAEPKAVPPQDGRRPPQRAAPTKPAAPRAMAASAKADMGTSASSTAPRAERGTPPVVDVPEPSAPDAAIPQGKPGVAEHEPLVTARALPRAPLDNGREESPRLQTSPTPGDPVATSAVRSNPDVSPPPAPTALHPEPALPAVVEPTPVPSVHDHRTTAERPVESVSS